MPKFTVVVRNDEYFTYTIEAEDEGHAENIVVAGKTDDGTVIEPVAITGVIWSIESIEETES